MALRPSVLNLVRPGLHGDGKDPNVKHVLAFIALVAVSVFGSAALPPVGRVEALPSNCVKYAPPGYTIGYTNCYSGGGMHRIKLRCTGGGWIVYVWGPWRGIGDPSVRKCPVRDPILVGDQPDVQLTISWGWLQRSDCVADCTIVTTS